MSETLLKELVESGAHFGHKVSLWNPRMKPYIYGTKKRIHIIDVRETIRGMVRATYLLRKIVQAGGEVLLVGIKLQAQHIIKTEAVRCGMHYAAERWIGGTLTNFNTIRSQLKKLLDMEKRIADGTMAQYKKKEQVMFQREIKRLQKNLGGIRNMTRLPAVMVAVDYKKSRMAIKETKVINIPTICLMDTDGDPTDVTVPIPVNDDGIRSIQIIVNYLASAILEARSKMEVKPLEARDKDFAKVKVIPHERGPKSVTMPVVKDKEAEHKPIKKRE